jgi:glycosyltransferase involved in cell wall biosynthesis
VGPRTASAERVPVRSHRSEPAITTTAFVATYAPHPCGIATFTYDLATAAFPRQIVALHPPDGPAAYPAEVRHRIRRDVAEDYLVIGQALNTSGVDVVSIQYQDGIWGGEQGAYVLDLVDTLSIPVVTTLHVVPKRPTPGQQRIIRRLVEASAASVAMSAAAAQLLGRTYGADPARLDVVPHGVPNLPLVDPDTIKPRLGLDGRRVILSFGLLGPGKGFETVIEAMPAVVAADPTALYVILGATHPDRLAESGEAYREELAARAERLGVSANVRFEDRFMGRVELATWLEAADVFAAPFLDLDRVTSGTLSYAMGAGKAVVATPFAYAKERLTRGRGMVVEPGSPALLADAFTRLLGDRTLRDSLGKKAYADTRADVWSAVGASYGRIFARVARPSVRPPAPVRRLAPIGR